MSEAASPLADPDDLRDWACQTVGVSAGATESELRTALLRRLTAIDFVPPQDWDSAIDVLAPDNLSTPASVPLGYYHERESELQLEVERFAINFYSLPLPERRETWVRLSQKCVPWPALRRWLKRLELGLDINSQPHENLSASVARMRQVLCGVFLQLPGTAGQEVRSQLALMRGDISRWEPVAVAFRHECPDIAQLCPKLVGEFADYKRHLRRRQFATSWQTFIRKITPSDLNLRQDSRQWTLIFIWLAIVGLSSTVAFVFKSASIHSSELRRVAPVQIAPVQTTPIKLPEITISRKDLERIQGSKPEDLKSGEGAFKILLEAGVLKVIPVPNSDAKTQKPLELPSSTSPSDASAPKNTDSPPLDTEGRDDD